MTLWSPSWSGARVAESGSLLRSCAPQGYRGFESPLLRKQQYEREVPIEVFVLGLNRKAAMSG